MDDNKNECPGCGAQNEPTANVCIDCGTPLAIDETDSVLDDEETEEEETEEEDEDWNDPWDEELEEEVETMDEDEE